LGVWLWAACSSPDACSNIPYEESSLLQQAGLLGTKLDTKVASSRLTSRTTDSTKKQNRFSKITLFLHTSVWAVFCSHFVQNCQQYLAEWLPFFYTEHLGLNPESSNLYLAIVASVELPARTLTKSIPEKMANLGMPLLSIRKTMSLLGFSFHFILIASVITLLHFQITSAIPFTIAFSLAKSSQALHAGGYFANYLDLTRNHAGMLTGVGNTVASIAGIVVPRFVALNLNQGNANWGVVMMAMIALNLVAALTLANFMSTDSLDDAAEPMKETGGKVVTGGKCGSPSNTDQKDRNSN